MIHLISAILFGAFDARVFMLAVDSFYYGNILTGLLDTALFIVLLKKVDREFFKWFHKFANKED